MEVSDGPKLRNASPSRKERTCRQKAKGPRKRTVKALTWMGTPAGPGERLAEPNQVCGECGMTVYDKMPS